MNKTKSLILIVFTMLPLWGKAQQSTPLDNWLAGSANDDVFIEASQEQLNNMVKNGLTCLEVDWYVGVYKFENNRKELEKWARGIKQRADKAGVTVWSAHLPFNRLYDISTVDEDIRQQAIRNNIADMELSAKTLAPRYFVIHPSLEPISDEERPQRIDACRKSLKQLAEKAQELNCILLVENLPRTCLGNTSAEIMYLIKGIEPIGICFDVNHLLKENHTDFIRNTRGKVLSTHMSDYDFIDEKHWLPGEGLIDWNELLDELIKAGYNGPFIYEPTCGKLPYAPSIKDMGNRWKELKQSYAKYDTGKGLNRALKLDGKTNNVCIGMDIIPTPWTLEAWIKGTNNSWKEEEVIIGGGEYSNLDGIDNLPLIVRDGKVCNPFTGLSTSGIPVNEWQHVALTSDGKTTRLYLNGKLADSKLVDSHQVLPGSLGVQEDTTSVFGGLLDEVRIWTDALPEETLSQWMNKPLRPSHPAFVNLKGYYNFDEGIGESAINWVGKGHQAYHIRNTRLDYKKKTPLASTVIANNPMLDYSSKEKQELFNAVVIDSEWDVDQSAIGDQILKLRIIVTGTEDVLTLEQLQLDLSGTTNIQDISTIHVYYAGKQARITEKQELFGTGIQPQSHLTLNNDKLTLTLGVNYILVTADIAKSATAGNTIKITIPSFSLNGKQYIPQTSPGMNEKKITVNSRNDSSVFRVLDWNIWHGGNHLGYTGVERVAELIQATNPDIVTMQEGYGSQERIASMLDLNLKTHSPKDNLALFSRYPIRPLPATETFKSNPGIITLPNGQEILVNSSWIRYAYKPEYTGRYPQQGYDTNVWVAEDSILGLKDMTVILEKDTYPYISSDMPVIIAGDFNSFSHMDWTASAASLHCGYGPVSFPISQYMLQNGFTDSFREMHPDEVTRPEGTFAVIFGYLQTGRIDFIYYKPGKIQAISSKIIRSVPEIDDIWPSDHAAVVTTFKQVQ